MEFECHHNTYTFGDATFGDVHFFGDEGYGSSPLLR